jgi:hypothetical protein
MSEYDLRCVNCYHKSHEGKDCPYCPMPTKAAPNSRCKDFVRADIFMARTMARMEQYQNQTHGQIMMAMSAIFDLMQEAYPDAAAAMKAKLELHQKAAEAEMELQRTKSLAEADQALEAAKGAEERRALTELAMEYQDKAVDNVIPFPIIPDLEPEPEPEKA